MDSTSLCKMHEEPSLMSKHYNAVAQCYSRKAQFYPQDENDLHYK